MKTSLPHIHNTLENLLPRLHVHHRHTAATQMHDNLPTHAVHQAVATNFRSSFSGSPPCTLKRMPALHCLLLNLIVGKPFPSSMAKLSFMRLKAIPHPYFSTSLFPSIFSPPTLLRITYRESVLWLWQKALLLMKPEQRLGCPVAPNHDTLLQHGQHSGRQASNFPREPFAMTALLAYHPHGL